MTLLARLRRPPGRERTPAEDGRERRHRLAADAATVLAALLVLVALVAPNRLESLAPAAFVRIPVEAVVGGALLLVLPTRPRRVVAALAGVALGLVAILKLLDMGFVAVLARPFDPVLDWVLVGAAVEFVAGSTGAAGAVGAVLGAIVLAGAVLILVTWSVLRLAGVAARHRPAATRVVTALAATWVACALLGAQIVPDVPVAAGGAAALARDRTLQVHASLQDRRAFAAQAAADAYGDTGGEELLIALRGKDVVVAFVESYGRDAVEDPEFGPQIGAVLDDGNRRLDAAGFASRSAFLTSPVAGGSSWLAHATFLSGLRIDNPQRHRTLLASDRTTLGSAFRRAGWRTVAVMPGTTRAWPEGAFFGYDRVYDSRDLGYRGPNFSWATMPDQYTLSAFERLERDRPDRGPLMAEIALVSSHAPWSPLPRLIRWEDVGDGSAFDPMAGEGYPPSVIWTWDRARVRTEYRRAIEYSLTSLISYVETHGGDDLVLVVLGDHQPGPIITDEGAGHDVPITVVTRDRAVLERIADWGWQDGLKPGPAAPVWPMEAFRDRFLAAFGP